MKHILTTIVLLVATAVCLSAQSQSLFETSEKYDFSITKATSLGKSVRIQSGVVTEKSGLVQGDISFNAKSCTIKFSDRRIKYNLEDLDIKLIDQAALTSGKGQMADGSGAANFQMIEDFRTNEINLIIEWPDHSSVQLLAKQKGTE